MSAFKSDSSAIAGIVFLALYTVYILLTANVVFRVGLKTRFTMLLIYGILKLVGQIFGVILASVGMEHWQYLIVYLVFSVVGFYMLVMTLFQFVCKAQIESYGLPQSKDEREQAPTLQNDNVIAGTRLARIVRLVLLVGNILNIYGTASIAGQNLSTISPSDLMRSKACRTAGGVIFLLVTIFSIVLAFRLRLKEKIRNSVHLNCCFIAAPFMIIRCIFGILTIYVPAMNYFDTANYTAAGLGTNVIIYEYVLGTSMEFIAAMVYISSFYWLKQRQPANAPIYEYHTDEPEKEGSQFMR